MDKPLHIEHPDLEPALSHAGFALWNLGFRPFYLLASVFSALSVLVWAGQFLGWLPSGVYLQGSLWHAHEMLFGFTVAVIAGFLLTAVRVWTSQPTPSGIPLALLAAFWLIGRVLVLTPYGTAAAYVNAGFPVAVPAVLGLVAGLDIVLFVMAVMGGRVIPMFTNNGIPGTQARRLPLVEKFSLGGLLVLLVVDLMQGPETVVLPVTIVCALAHAVRLYLWQPWRTLATPLVWILHAGYAWIVVHLALRAMSAAGLLAESLALHALTVGAIGGLTIGMMTRTARGHTGRPLKADGYEAAAYVLVQLAALVRVAGGLLLPGVYVVTVVGSALLWSAAFALYAVRYWPVLSRPRLDGKPG
jgi:uncharacterized protein involved in response to NO